MEEPKELVEENLEKQAMDEMEKFDYEMDHEKDLIREERKAITRSFLESKGVSSEKYETMFDRLGDRELPLSQRDIKEKTIREAADEVGEDDLEELADRLLEEDKITTKARKKFSGVMKKGRK